MADPTVCVVHDDRERRAGVDVGRQRRHGALLGSTGPRREADRSARRSGLRPPSAPDVSVTDRCGFCSGVIAGTARGTIHNLHDHEPDAATDALEHRRESARPGATAAGAAGRPSLRCIPRWQAVEHERDESAVRGSGRVSRFAHDASGRVRFVGIGSYPHAGDDLHGAADEHLEPELDRRPDSGRPATSELIRTLRWSAPAASRPGRRQHSPGTDHRARGRRRRPCRGVPEHRCRELARCQRAAQSSASPSQI